MNGSGYHAFSQFGMSNQRRENPGLANNSSWNDSPYAFAPNTNTLDEQSMPSDQAAAARAKSAQVMAALKSGEPGAADKLMGDNEGKSAAAGLTPLGGPKGWFQKIKQKRDGKGKVPKPQNEMSGVTGDSGRWGVEQKSKPKTTEGKILGLMDNSARV